MTLLAQSNAAFRMRVEALAEGIAFGDALGATVEHMTADEIRRRYGRVTTIDMPWHKSELPDEVRGYRIRGHGIFTDDTHMTLCLMALYQERRCHLDAWDMATGMTRQIAWTPRWLAELQREGMLLDRLFYPEKWIFIRHQLASCEPREGGIGNMINCGAAMYIAPVGVVNACDPRAAYDEAIAFASGHQASYGLEAAGVMAACVAAAFLPDATMETVIDSAIELAKDGTRAAIADIATEARAMRSLRDDHARVTARFHEVIGRYSSIGDDTGRRPEKAGRPTNDHVPSRLRTIEELPLALGYALLNDGAFRKTVEDCINSGRDTDSIGSMAGAILGAMHGPGGVSDDERARIDAANKVDLVALSGTFSDVALEIMTADARRARDLARARDAFGVTL